jgi:hypothetical protein
VLLLAALVNVLNEKTICPIWLFLPRAAHMSGYTILSRINLAKTRLLATHDSTRLIRKHILSELIPRVVVILFEHGKDLPEVRMNNVIVIQKVNHSFINVHKSNISLTVSRTGSRRTHMTILDDLRMGKNLVVDSLGLVVS